MNQSRTFAGKSNIQIISIMFDTLVIVYWCLVVFGIELISLQTPTQYPVNSGTQRLYNSNTLTIPSKYLCKFWHKTIILFEHLNNTVESNYNTVPIPLEIPYKHQLNTESEFFFLSIFWYQFINTTITTIINKEILCQ